MNLKLDINPHDICRICMTQSNNLTNYFKVIVKDGYRFVFPDMVLKCLDIQSDPNDGLPDKICDVCEKEITNFHLFKEKSARTEQILLSAFNKPQRNKQPNEPSKLSNTIATQTTKVNLFTCVKCKMIFKTENLLLKHVSHRHSNVDASCQTEEFDSTVDDGIIEETPESIEMDFKRDMKLEADFEVDDNIEKDEMHIDMEDNFSKQKMDDQTEFDIELKPQLEYQCEDCLCEFTEIDAWHNHKCPKVIVQVVDQTFDATEYDELSEDYYEELILEDESLKCVQCHEKFSNMEEYTIHCDNNVHYYNCQQCNLSFNDQESFESHNAKHIEEFHCAICFKRFKTTTTFSQHQK